MARIRRAQIHLSGISRDCTFITTKNTVLKIRRGLQKGNTYLKSNKKQTAIDSIAEKHKSTASYVSTSPFSS